MRARAAALLLFAFALAACAELRWHKPGADAAALAADSAACRKQAREAAARAGYLGLPPVADPRFGTPSGPSQAEQVMQERQAADRCMRERGYALVPAEK
jgi:hypothetical protein